MSIDGLGSGVDYGYKGGASAGIAVWTEFGNRSLA